MTEVEDRLRAALARRAEQAPVSATLLAGVRVAHGRQRRRRLVIAGGLAAVAVAVSVLVVPLVTPLGPGGPTLAGAGQPPSAAQSASPGPGLSVGQGLAGNGVTLAPGDPYTVVFPFAPGGGLAALGTASAMLVAGVPTLSYHNGAVMVTATGTAPSTVAASVGPRSTVHSVHGHQAILTQTPGTTGGQRTGRQPTPGQQNGDQQTPSQQTPSQQTPSQQTLSWQPRVGLWVGITAIPAVPVNTLLGYANGLSVGSVALVRPYTFGVVPVGLLVDNVTPGVVTFRPASVQPGVAFAGKIAVMLAKTGQSPLTGRVVQVAGRAAWLGGTDYTLLQVPLDDGDTLQVQVPATIPFAEADLLRFAAGIQPTAASQVSPG